jgi:hypothetical protein
MPSPGGAEPSGGFLNSRLAFTPAKQILRTVLETVRY